jgi:hypothetical protein
MGNTSLGLRASGGVLNFDEATDYELPAALPGLLQAQATEKLFRSYTISALKMINKILRAASA